MRRVLVFLIIAAIVVAAAWYLAGLPGTVTAQLGDWTYQASVAVTAICLLAIFLLLYLIVRFLIALFTLPFALRMRRAAYRRHHGQIATTRALVALAAGERADARRESARARRLLGDTPQTLLLAAEAGRLADRPDEAEAAFTALTAQSDAAFLGYRGLLRQAVEREDWTAASALAGKAEAAHPGASWLRQERAQLAVRTENWRDALILADEEAPTAVLATAAARAEPDPDRALALAKRAWKDDPGLPPAAIEYAERLRQLGKPKRAMAVLRRSWAATPHPDLAELALAPFADKQSQLRTAAELTRDNPNSPETRLLLGRLSLEAGLFADARLQADTARDDGVNQRRLWLLLADIEQEERGETEEGRLAQREALRRAATADPDPDWMCSKCGTPQPAWHPVCPVCGGIGTLKWSTHAQPLRSSLVAA